MDKGFPKGGGGGGGPTFGKNSQIISFFCLTAYLSVLKCFRVLLKRKEGHMKIENEEFCLQWTDFESNISIAFRELREEKDFFDVTLVCNEGQTQAHKVFTLCPIYTSPFCLFFACVLSS